MFLFKEMPKSIGKMNACKYAIWIKDKFEYINIKIINIYRTEFIIMINYE